MLGLFTGIQYEDANIINSPEDVSGLIGWWDFTDNTQLYQDIDSYDNQVVLQNQKIGRCKNKAFDGLLDLGRFARAEADANRPTYKQNGQNGHSYAVFDSSSNIEGLVTRSTSTDWGAFSDNRLSITYLSNYSMQIFVVGEPEDNDSDGTDETVFSYLGYRGVDTSITDEEQSTTFTLERQDDEDVIATWALSGDPPVSPNTINGTQPSSHWETGEVSIINISTSTAVGGSYIYNNNTPDVGQTIYWAGSGDFAQEGIADMNPSGYTSGVNGLTTSVGIGAQTSSSGVLASGSFDGKIYEILVYDSDMSESDRAGLTYYLSNKYDITISN